jgi:hypothetical protein
MVLQLSFVMHLERTPRENLQGCMLLLGVVGIRSIPRYFSAVGWPPVVRHQGLMDCFPSSSSLVSERTELEECRSDSVFDECLRAHSVVLVDTVVASNI